MREQVRGWVVGRMIVPFTHRFIQRLREMIFTLFAIFIFMPEITADERGRRVFQIQRKKAVENAIEKIRLNLGQDWKLFSSSDIEMIEQMLGEVWISIGKQRWERLAFTRLTKGNIDEIVHIGKEMSREGKTEQAAIIKVVDIMNRVG
jgi:hypothetical protein